MRTTRRLRKSSSLLLLFASPWSLTLAATQREGGCGHRHLRSVNPHSIPIPRYDYLEFTDESGEKYKCDGEVGKERWPTHLDFKGQKLHFKFYSDSSNNEWGYKFTVSGCGYMLGWAWLLE